MIRDTKLNRLLTPTDGPSPRFRLETWLSKVLFGGPTVHPSCIVLHFSAAVALVAVILIIIVEWVLALIITFQVLTVLCTCCLFVCLCSELFPFGRVPYSAHRGARSRHNEGNEPLFWISDGKSAVL